MAWSHWVVIWLGSHRLQHTEIWPRDRLQKLVAAETLAASSLVKSSVFPPKQITRRLSFRGAWPSREAPESPLHLTSQCFFCRPYKTRNQKQELTKLGSKELGSSTGSQRCLCILPPPCMPRGILLPKPKLEPKARFFALPIFSSFS